MNKRIMSVVMSALLVVVAILFLQNEKVVEAADDIVLLEKRHPGYWMWLREKAVDVDMDADGKVDVTVYPVSKMYLKDITHEDYELFLKDTERAFNRRFIYFLDGTGIDVNKAIYGEVDINTWEINEEIDKVVDHEKYVSLSKNSDINEFGINGIQTQNKPLSEIVDVYQYLSELSTRNYTFVIAEMDDAKNAWNESMENALCEMGFKGDFQSRDSYIAIFDQGIAIYEDKNQSKIEWHGKLQNRDLYVKSSGYYSGADNSICLDGQEYSEHGRGLNILVMQNGEVIDSVNFDTWNEFLPCSR